MHFVKGLGQMGSLWHDARQGRNEMDDDLPRRISDHVKDLETEDLSSYSIHELDERMARLLAEIERVKILKDAKGASHAAADAIFGKAT